MTGNNWAQLIEDSQARLVELERKRDEALGTLSTAAGNVRANVIAHLDGEIAKTLEAIDNFKWAQDHDM
jgi:predicted negative regulator of RcsB-dependent stress response